MRYRFQFYNPHTGQRYSIVSPSLLAAILALHLEPGSVLVLSASRLPDGHSLTRPLDTTSRHKFTKGGPRHATLFE